MHDDAPPPDDAPATPETPADEPREGAPIPTTHDDPALPPDAAQALFAQLVAGNDAPPDEEPAPAMDEEPAPAMDEGPAPAMDEGPAPAMDEGPSGEQPPSGEEVPVAAPAAAVERPRPQEEDDEPAIELPETLPILPLKDTVVYPMAVTPLGVGKERSIRLIDEVMRGPRLVGLVAQKDPEVEEAGPDDCYRVGTVARIARLLRIPDGTIQIIVQGLERIVIEEFVETQPFLTAHCRLAPETSPEDIEIEALKRNAIDMFQRLGNLVQYLPDQLALAAMNLDDPRQIVYLIASSAQMDLALRQELLELDSVREKLEKVTAFLTRELEVLELGKKIQSQAQEEMGKAQREYFLREQLKAIQKELGEESDEVATVNELREKIEQAGMGEEALKEAQRELGRLEKLQTASPEYSVIRTYLETMVALPWSKSTGKPIDVPFARQVLDEDHYDLEKIKARILEYLAVRRLKEDRQGTQTGGPGTGVPTSREPILCFVGPPGVGKTSLGHSIARALGREFVRMSLGGIHDEAEIRGHRRARCRGVSSRPSAAPAPTTLSSCWTRWTSSPPIGAATRRPRCWRCSTRSRTTPSATITSTCPSTSPRSSSSPRPTRWSRSPRRCATAWRPSSFRAIPRRRSCTSRGATCCRSRSRPMA